MTNPATQAAQYIKKQAPHFKPKAGIILGSGLGPLADSLEEVTVIDYQDIPGFPTCSVEGHSPQMYLGKIKGVPVVCLKGRAHFYEGYSRFDSQRTVETLLAPVRTLKLLGCDFLLATNSAGSLRENVAPGSLVLVNDHINLQFNSPLAGPNDNTIGPRFVGMEDAYDPEIRDQFKQMAAQLKIPLTEGVYIGVLGPQFETPAEIRAFRIWGADVVGMSTIPEVIAARHCGLKVGVISVITNYAAGMTDTKLSHDVTLSGAKKAIDQLIHLILGFFENLPIAIKA